MVAAAGAPRMTDDHVVGTAGGDGVPADVRAVAGPAVVVAGQDAVGGVAELHVGVEAAANEPVHADRDVVAGQGVEAPVVRVGPRPPAGDRVDRAQAPALEVAAADGVLDHLQRRGLGDDVVVGVLDDGAGGRGDGKGVDVVITSGAVAVAIQVVAGQVLQPSRDGGEAVQALLERPGRDGQRDLCAGDVGRAGNEAVQYIVRGVEQPIGAGGAHLPVGRAVDRERLEILTDLHCQAIDGRRGRAAFRRQRQNLQYHGRSAVEQ